MIRCRDGSLYTGISTDVERRYKEHYDGGGRGSKYLRGRGPLEIVFSRQVGDRCLALKLEKKLKKSAKKIKEALVESPSEMDAWITEDSSA